MPFDPEGFVKKLQTVAGALDGLAKSVGDLGEKFMYPTDFEKRDPSYQLAWLDQQIPELEGKMVRLEAHAAASPSFDKARTPLRMRNYLEGNISQDELETRQDLKRIDLLRHQIAELKARKTSLTGLLPTPVPAAPHPSQQQHRAQVLADVKALEAERDAVVATINDPTMQQQVRVRYAQLIQKELEKI